MASWRRPGRSCRRRHRTTRARPEGSALGIGLLDVAVLAVAVWVAWRIYTAARQRALPADPVALSGAVWEPAHYGTGRGVTRVVVRLGRPGGPMDERTIAEIPDDDPEWDARFTDAMAKARERAAVLNVEDGRR